MTVQTLVPSLPPRLTVVGAAPQAQSPPRVLLVTEGTYPFHWGGVSTWCDALVKALPDVPFHVLAIASQPGQAPVFTRPANLVGFRAVPLWGLQDVKETWVRPGWRDLHRARSSADDQAAQREFVPALRRFLAALLAPAADPVQLARDLHAMHRYLLDHDLDRTLRSAAVWQACVEELSAGHAREADDDFPPLQLWEITTAFQWLSRWLFPLAAPLPQVDVVHAAMAGVCSIVSVVVKLEHGAGFFLTEHGVYLRERYLDEADRRDSWFLKLLALRFARRMTEMSYALADQISPCCDYNQRWEAEIGAQPAQLETIYYGVEGEQYAPAPPPGDTPFQVVWVGRINPLKDVETLLRAAAGVIAQRPDARFRLYGTAPAEDADYHRRCLALHAELGLQDAVTFCGFTDDPASAYNEGDVVILSSVSEGFPFSTLEAMLCGRPVVATSVGGIPEQIEGAGLVVEPRDPEAMAAAVLALLDDEERCRSLGRAARERALGLFAARRFRGAHASSYLRLSPRHRHWQANGTAPAVGPARRPPQPTAPPEPGTVPAIPAPRGRLTATELARLVALVRRRTPHPVDALEVAAVLESAGVGDVQAQEHGFADVFRLAETVLREARRSRPAAPATARPDHDAPEVEPRLDTARHPLLALLPTVALLTAIWGMTRSGSWSGHAVLALTAGMTSGMLFTNGLTLAMGRRASSLLSLGKTAAARTFLLSCVAVGTAGTALLATAVTLVPWEVVDPLHEHRWVFVGAAVVLAAIWVLAAALSLVRVSGWGGVGLSAGVVTGVVLDEGLVPHTERHLAVGTAVGTLVAVGVLLAVLERQLRTRRVPTTARVRLPALPYLVLEGLPYLAYGTLAVVMFVSVHLLGWRHLDGIGQPLTTLELGLFLPLLPAVVAAGHAERSLRAFWRRATALQTGAVADRADFGRGLQAFYREALGRWARSLLIASVLCTVAVEVLIRTGALVSVVPYGDPVVLRGIYASGLVAYGLLAWGQFASMFCLSLVRPQGPLLAVLLGSLTTVVAGLALTAQLGHAVVGLALVLGAGVHVLVASRSLQRLLLDGEHSYASAL